MTNDKTENTEEKKTIKFKYVIPKDLRDFYVNGLWGGITPRNEIHMQFYTERHPIPKSKTYEIKDDKTLGDTLETDLGGDVVRVIQASIIFDMDTAISIRDWLNTNIDLIKKRIKSRGE